MGRFKCKSSIPKGLELLLSTIANVKENLNPAYDDPDDENNIFAGWETADEYLSGRVKDKLAAAELAAEDNPIYAVNAEALRAVQLQRFPARLSYYDIISFYL